MANGIVCASGVLNNLAACLILLVLGMKKLLLLILTTVALFGMVHAQVNLDKAIAKYVGANEGYSTFEVYEESGNGTRLTNLLVLIRDSPAFVLSANGTLVENISIILSVSRDYVSSRPTGTGVASAEDITAAIVGETAKRKQSGKIREAGDTAFVELNKVKSQVSEAKVNLAGSVGFIKIDDKITSLERKAKEISASSTIENVVALNTSFYAELAPFSLFIRDVSINAPKLGVAIASSKQARLALNDKTVKVGRDNPTVVEMDIELTRIESITGEQVNRIETLVTPNAIQVNEAYDRSQAALAKINTIQGSGSNLGTLAALLVIALLILAGVAYYFKKLNEKNNFQAPPMPRNQYETTNSTSRTPPTTPNFISLQQHKMPEINQDIPLDDVEGEKHAEN